MLDKNCEVISLSGATTDSLNHVVENSDPNSNLTQIYVHVGFKDSHNGPSDNSTGRVKQLIQAVSHKYKNAICYISAVLPKRGNHNRRNIDQYNLMLQSVCDDTNAVYIDLTDQVISNFSNRVNDNLYYDPVHITANGAKLLATVIKPLLCDNTVPSTEKRIPLKQTGVKSSYDNHFQGHGASVHSFQEMRNVLSQVYLSEKTRNATSIMYAYRLSDGTKITSDCFDDREHKAGSCILKYLENNNLVNVVVIITREYSCHIYNERWNIIKSLTTEIVSAIKPERSNPSHTFDRRQQTPAYGYDSRRPRYQHPSFQDIPPVNTRYAHPPWQISKPTPLMHYNHDRPYPKMDYAWSHGPSNSEYLPHSNIRGYMSDPFYNRNDRHFMNPYS